MSGGGSAVKFGADGGHIQYIDLLLDSADAPQTADQAVDILRRDVARFVGAAPQSDDITIVAVRRQDE